MNKPRVAGRVFCHAKGVGLVDSAHPGSLIRYKEAVLPTRHERDAVHDSTDSVVGAPVTLIMTRSHGLDEAPEDVHFYCRRGRHNAPVSRTTIESAVRRFQIGEGAQHIVA